MSNSRSLRRALVVGAFAGLSLAGTAGSAVAADATADQPAVAEARTDQVGGLLGGANGEGQLGGLTNGLPVTPDALLGIVKGLGLGALPI
ncbi:hypothetical protein [Prauserella endophytica]|uniref:ATP-binding protein n=1 Tax=Prauserella endophytica TaxID=1592324 RepID=A0ABY2S7A0_9PSEU|nr:hypothetical protein [Prauserella endophytica]PXY25921.1 hypothetical protein BAY59_20375 [Prauserella coralliicola]TKG71798.1 hypothetical protein FCN18_09885 [Prauserella endophytica]